MWRVCVDNGSCQVCAQASEVLCWLCLWDKSRDVCLALIHTIDYDGYVLCWLCTRFFSMKVILLSLLPTFVYVEHYSLAVVSSPTHAFTQIQTYMYTCTCTQAIPSCEFQIPNFVTVCVTHSTNCKWWANSSLNAGPCASAFIRSCANLVHRSHLLNLFCYDTTKISIN